MNIDEVKAIYHQDKDEIIHKYQSTGAGIGMEGAAYVITVYLPEQRANVGTVGESWKGVPIRFRVIGQVSAQAGL
jgi:hypothetical protein